MRAGEAPADPPAASMGGAPERVSALPLKGTAAGAYGSGALELLVTELMTRTKAGDPRAFEELVGHVRVGALRMARALVGSPDDALDLCQEAFLKTYRARTSYRDGEAFLPWFHRILRNTCFSFLRKHKRLRTHSLSGAGPEEDDGEWVLAEDGPDPSRGVEAEEHAELFWKLFEKLKANDREILALRHFEELSYREIAARLAIPEGTVMSRLFHARRRLRDLLSLHPSLLDDGAASDEAGQSESSR